MNEQVAKYQKISSGITTFVCAILFALFFYGFMICHAMGMPSLFLSGQAADASWADWCLIVAVVCAAMATISRVVMVCRVSWFIRSLTADQCKQLLNSEKIHGMLVDLLIEKVNEDHVRANRKN